MGAIVSMFESIFDTIEGGSVRLMLVGKDKGGGSSSAKALLETSGLLTREYVVYNPARSQWRRLALFKLVSSYLF